MIVTRRWLAALLLISASCATSSGTAETSPSASKNPNVISRAELADPAIQSMNALKAIRYLRASFFRGFAADDSPGAAQAFFSFDYGPLQPINELAGFNTLNVQEVRYLDARVASGRFGLQAYGRSVIVLLSNKLTQ